MDGARIRSLLLGLRSGGGTVKVTNTVPYVLRETAGGATVGDKSYPTLTGGTLVWNQLLDNGNFAEVDVNGHPEDWTATASGVTWSASDGVCTVNVAASSATPSIKRIGQNNSFVDGHKYLVCGMAKCTIDKQFESYAGSSASALPRVYVDVGTDWTQFEFISSALKTDVGGFVFGSRNATYDFSYDVKNIQMFDLTLMLGAEIADYIYGLESETAGAGFAKLKAWGFLAEAYYATNEGELMSVNTSAHVTREADDTLIGNYALDASLTLRGIPKLGADGELYYDGDIYRADGSVTRKYGERTYQSGDEDLSDAITDGTNTVYRLAANTQETADTYQSPQDVADGGTEEYIDAGVAAGTRDVSIPVGHTTIYGSGKSAKTALLLMLLGRDDG